MEPLELGVTELRWQRMEELFHAAMAYPEAERAARVREWSGGDTTLVDQLLAMLEADSAVEEKLAAGADGAGALTRGDAAEAWIGRRLGVFELERVLGRGGMGVVFLGRRVEGLAQAVAVKVMGRHLVASPAVAQFLRERETLAQMEHGNIARLLDGGVEGGTPYVVMEYVEGRRLDEVCDDAATRLEEKLRLMLQLCEAVGYAHRNLILHRDLKPGNVMVTAEGVVKLLDFGTFKLLGPREQDSAMTQAGMRAVTLRYASPEHIEGGAVSTAADVYSLGMVLYRMVAGRLPDGLDGLPVGTYLERLQEENFVAPSAVKGLAGRLAGDVDAIVLKALRYEAGARYGSVGALAEDLKHALEDLPVAARAGSRRYRVGKFYRRHRVALVGSGAVLVVLAGGVAAMVRQGQVARAEERRAEAGVEEERKLAHLLLFDYFDELKEIPGSTDAQRRAATQAVGYLDALNQSVPAGQLGNDLERDTIRGYSAMGELLGNPYTQNLGDFAGAAQTLRKATELARRRVDRDPEDLAAVATAAGTEQMLGEVFLGSGDAAQAVAHLDRAAALSKTLVEDSRVNGDQLHQAAVVVASLGEAYNPAKGFVTSDLKKAEMYYNLSDEYDGMCLRVQPTNKKCEDSLPIGQYQLGYLLATTDPKRAGTYYRHGVELVAKYPPEKMSQASTQRVDIYLRSGLALSDMETGATVEGIHLYEQIHSRFQAAVAKDPRDNRAQFDLVAFDDGLSTAYDMVERERDALLATQEMVEHADLLVQRSPKTARWQRTRARALLLYGKYAMKAGNRQQGEQSKREGLELAVKLAQENDASDFVLELASRALVDQRRKAGDGAVALEFAHRALKMSTVPDADTWLAVADAAALAGKMDEARMAARKTLVLMPNGAQSKSDFERVGRAKKILQP